MEQKEVRYPTITNDKGSLTHIEKQILGSLMILSGAGTILELGVFKGVTTKFICNFLIKNDIPAKVYGFDIPQVVETLTGDPELKRFIELGILELVPGFLPDSLQSWLSNHTENIDFVLDDAKHDYPSVYSELKLIWPRLSDQGIVVCHDYTEVFKGVVHAVNKFSKRKGVTTFPLTSSTISGTRGFSSVLVGLRKPQQADLLSHRIQQELLRYRMAFAKTVLWKKVLRPLLK